MTNCTVSYLPIDDDHEYCIDILHESKKDNNLPLITTTPQMPATIKTQDRPVVLYMAPIQKQQSECICGKMDKSGCSGVAGGIQKINLQ